MKRVPIKVKANCCDDGKHLTRRRGGGYRCKKCGNIFDDYGRLIGEDESDHKVIRVDFFSK